MCAYYWIPEMVGFPHTYPASALGGAVTFVINDTLYFRSKTDCDVWCDTANANEQNKWESSQHGFEAPVPSYYFDRARETGVFRAHIF